jgi:hypothetical protein
MQQIRTLAPTLFHALNAVEMGCRKAQHDPQLTIRMASWMTVTATTCFGSLITCTLLHLSNKTAVDVIRKFTPKAITPHKSIIDRSYAYEIAKDTEDLYQFEIAIDNLRFNELYPLLVFYGYNEHPARDEAVDWLYAKRAEKLTDDCTKADLLLYADFIRNILFPQLQKWFAPHQ